MEKTLDILINQARLGDGTLTKGISANPVMPVADQARMKTLAGM
jgi:hypothetical protein